MFLKLFMNKSGNRKESNSHGLLRSLLTGNTPEAFKKALLDAKHFFDKYNLKHKILVLILHAG